MGLPSNFHSLPSRTWAMPPQRQKHISQKVGMVATPLAGPSAAVAMRLVPAQQVPKALAVFNGGNALATVVAAPLGSYLGGVIGWRGAFFCLLPVALIALR